ncbi:MAG TPA: autotransporter-associated beta strand repeat-containing protein, partial [Tepidisphaeraceae bacterium]|nr:autotransporter-associated beta strand repeat-containing protein [Tepidisphaeraceae bacterium]
MKEKQCRRATLLVAVAVLAGVQAAWAGISFDGVSRVNLTHDADVSNAGDVPFSTGLIAVPRSVDIFPTNPYQLDHTFTSGAANTIALGSLGRVTNATTASFVLAAGTGVTQTDPINAYPGESSLKFDVDLNWNVTTGGFGPLANGFASLNTGVVVGVGGSAELQINLSFLNQNGTALRTPWIVNKTWTEGTYADTFSTSRVLGAGSLPAGSKLRIVGTIEFLASNADSPSRFDALRAEFGGTPPTGACITDAQGSWFDPRNWQQQTFDPNEPGLLTIPNGLGHRAWFAGTSALQAHTIGITDNITLGTLDINSPTPYNFTGSAPVTWSTQQREAVLNIRRATGSHSFTNPFVLASNLDAIVEGNSFLNLSGPVSGSQGITKFGAGTLLLSGSNSYSGPTVVNEGKLQFAGVGATPITVNSGAGLDVNGTIRNFVIARPLSHIAPGINGIGDATFEGLTLEPGSVLDIEGAGASFDSINLSANNTAVFKDGKVNLIQRSTFEPGKYPLIGYNGEPLGDLGGKLSLLNPYHGGAWASLSDDAGSTTVMLNIVPVPQWNVDANGTWGSAGNWLPAVVPSGATAVAGFLGKITAPRTVTIDGAGRTVGTIIFDNANRYTLTSGSLTIGDAANPGTIEVASGSHVISTLLTFAGNTQINIANGQALTLSGGTSAINANQTVNKAGDGTLTISGKFSAGAGSSLNVDGGTLNLNVNPGFPGSAASSPLAMSINGSKVVLGTSVDLKELQVNYAAPGAQTLDLISPLSSIGFKAVRVYSSNLDASKADLWNAIVNANQAEAPDPMDGIIDSNSQF